MKFIPVVMSILLSSCVHNEPLPLEKIEDETAGFVEYTDEKARAVGLVPLREKVIAAGNKEIRIWVGFGIISPEDLLILNIDGAGVVSGQKVLIYDRSSDAWKDEPEELEYFLESIYHRCDVIERYNNLESCGLKHNDIFDWGKIYKKLENLNVWSLPDESKLPKLDFVVLDGYALVVELHDGASYRAYHYSNPAFRKEKEAHSASEIMSFVLEL
ncbi:hypothetical protein [Pleionea sediminis]|uniref:hypothetical protein n=1 Tax=Pleionea sediminis TaxID=2569479 RepID=UPI00118522D1|nr:hypothetical protein [Pleionea sediminis]